MYRPLADRIRPRTLDEVAGQQRILGKDGILRRIIESGNIPNMIFYGPSGIGKTTVANIIAKQTERRLHRLNATTAGTGDIKDIIAELGTLLAPGGALLYLDEIQYFNKKQQQSLLEFIENGKITLIASTTENPYFYVYNAILSRCTVFEFTPPDKNEILPVVCRAFLAVEEESGKPADMEDGVREYIAEACGGDVRKAVNAVELLTNSSSRITMDDAKSVTQRSSMRYDRQGDEHYDILSAFHKSLRGSDPDAAVHYLARLLAAGDLPSVCRRLLCAASEDVGMAYPQAVTIVKACVDSALQLGLPEAQLPLAEAAVLIATAPKSNTAAFAVWAAAADVQAGKIGEIPAHIRDAHYAGAEKLGRGKTYKYPHDYPNGWVEQQYLPDLIKNRQYYKYGANKMEQATRKYWEEIKKGEKT